MPVCSGTVRTMKGGWRETQRWNYHPVQDCWAVRILLCTIWYSEFYGVLLYNLRRLESLGVHSVHSVHITLSMVVCPGARDLWQSAFQNAPQNSMNFIGILLYNLRRLESLTSTTSTLHPARPCVPVPGIFGGEVYSMHHIVFRVLLEFNSIIYTV